MTVLGFIAIEFEGSDWLYKDLSHSVNQPRVLSYCSNPADASVALILDAVCDSHSSYEKECLAEKYPGVGSESLAFEFD